jgi:hypothetical protein
MGKIAPHGSLCPLVMALRRTLSALNFSFSPSTVAARTKIFPRSYMQARCLSTTLVGENPPVQQCWPSKVSEPRNAQSAIDRRFGRGFGNSAGNSSTPSALHSGKLSRTSEIADVPGTTVRELEVHETRYMRQVLIRKSSGTRGILLAADPAFFSANSKSTHSVHSAMRYTRQTLLGIASLTRACGYSECSVHLVGRQGYVHARKNPRCHERPQHEGGLVGTFELRISDGDDRRTIAAEARSAQ